MRLRKGDQVEVLSKEAASSGSWSCAEILSDNDHFWYNVRYLSVEETVERVPRIAIRPCPPPVERTNIWFVGDLAEAFHNSSWKQAKIMKIVGVDCYIVRLLGSPNLDISVSQSNLRMRQAWHDGKWFLLQKGIEDLGSSRNRQTEPNLMKNKDQQPAVTLPTGSRKRPLPCQPINQNLSIWRRKVGSPSLTQELKKSNSPIENTNVTTSNAGLREGNLVSRTSTHIHTDSCVSSVGSNSFTNDSFKKPFISMARRGKKDEDTDYYSDAESSTGREHEEEDSCSYEEVLAKFHRSELSVFRSFIRALYASGPLSWEDEVEISNIRALLHISNDEYLLELRDLISTNKKTSV
ncbi:uncharacterized protein LOC120086627 [Benincasa hispida]|uniref:uncharacterized protein LOC120086627 n=1 Tax=Benincasa hispida TaxID=102211 RepID=UPI00190007E3|nr:uncharacterized protein LOC120086627 [Benincasa hispida]XP_038899294.1 uncharacterized protein LOC120086627 [Benincasa hispida]